MKSHDVINTIKDKFTKEGNPAEVHLVKGEPSTRMCGVIDQHEVLRNRFWRAVEFKKALNCFTRVLYG